MCTDGIKVKDMQQKRGCVLEERKKERELMVNEEVERGERKKRVQRDESIITHVINRALNRRGA